MHSTVALQKIEILQIDAGPKINQLMAPGDMTFSFFLELTSGELGPPRGLNSRRPTKQEHDVEQFRPVTQILNLRETKIR